MSDVEVGDAVAELLGADVVVIVIAVAHVDGRMLGSYSSKLKKALLLFSELVHCN